MKAFSLVGKEEYLFDDNTTALWAVCYAYCEENGRISALFASAQDGQFLEFSKTLPVITGKKSVSCGDWGALFGPEEAEIPAGKKLISALPGLRYTVSPEFMGAPGARFVARFCGLYIGCDLTQAGAIAIAHDHRKEYCARAGIEQGVQS